MPNHGPLWSLPWDVKLTPVRFCLGRWAPPLSHPSLCCDSEGLPEIMRRSPLRPTSSYCTRKRRISSPSRLKENCDYTPAPITSHCSCCSVSQLFFKHPGQGSLETVAAQLLPSFLFCGTRGIFEIPSFRFHFGVHEQPFEHVGRWQNDVRIPATATEVSEGLLLPSGAVAFSCPPLPRAPQKG